jgi:predicted alpha/beta-hydrolase family hydrolase
MPKSTVAGQVEQIEKEGVRGYLHRPAEGNGSGLVLTHGAGSGCNGPLLVAIANAFCAAGLFVLRCDLAFRQQRPKGPPFPSAAASDRESLRKALAVLRPMTKGQLILGGHSYGGRQASMLAAEEPEIAAALLLLAYPLHPPNKPEQPRTAHFPKLRTPSVFVSGANDPFGSPAELQTALSLIAAKATLFIVEGAGHDLKRGHFDLAQMLAAVPG